MENKQLQIAKDTIAKERNFKDWNDLNKGKIRVYNEEYIDQIAIEYHRLMSEWVSVDERLSEMGERVLTIDKNNNQRVAYLNLSYVWKYIGDKKNLYISQENLPTHWRELPQPPK